MDIGYFEWVAFGGHWCVLILFDIETCYTYSYGMRALLGVDVIQDLQSFFMDAGWITSKFYTEFYNRMIQGAAHK